jgi:hypothetical protein
MNTNAVVPDWLHDVFLGYGDPASAHYTQVCCSAHSVGHGARPRVVTPPPPIALLWR